MARIKRYVSEGLGETIDMFDYENYPIEEAFDFESEVESAEHADMYDRACALLAATPLAIAGVDARRTPFHLLDQNSLALRALDLSIGSVGLGSISEGGAQRGEMVKALCEAVREQLEYSDDIAAYPKDDDIVAYASDMIGHLIEPIRKKVYHPKSQGFRTEDRRVLREVDDERGEFYIRPSVEAINLFFGSLKVSLADEQIMLEALLEHQINQGLFKDAFQTALVLKKKALFYKEDVLEAKSRMTRNIRAMSWLDQVEPMIKEISATLDGLLITNRNILKTIQENFRLKESEKGPMVAALIKTIKDCIAIHKSLWTEVQSLDTHFSKEQSRQAFFSTSGDTLPNMLTDVLVSLFGVRREYFDWMSSELFSIFSPPRAQPVFNLTRIIDDALREKKVVEEVEPLSDEIVFTTPPLPILPNFSARQVERASDLIKEAVSKGDKHLSEIMKEGISNDMNSEILHAMAVLVVTTWPHTELQRNWSVKKTGESFSNAICTSDDFLISRGKGASNNE